MRVVDGSSAPYNLASRKAAQSAREGPAGLATQFCYRYFEVSTILLHLFIGLGLVISDLNYNSQA